MADGARTQATPPEGHGGRNPLDAPRPGRTRTRVAGMRKQALSVAPRAPGYKHALRAFNRDQRQGGALLAGALAFRLFGALLPLALLIAVLLGHATTVDSDAPREAGEAIGIAPALLQSIADSSRLSTGTRWSVAVFAFAALLWSAISAARAVRAVHSLAWDGAIGRFGRPLPAALVLLAALAAFLVVIVVAASARSGLGFAGLLVSIAAFAAFTGIWLGVALLLPHRDARWSDLLPGALLVALGVQVIHLGTVLFIADKIERASETYGSLGVAFTILLWLFVTSRVIVASAMLNAALAESRRPA